MFSCASLSFLTRYGSRYYLSYNYIFLYSSLLFIIPSDMFPRPCTLAAWIGLITFDGLDCPFLPINLHFSGCLFDLISVDGPVSLYYLIVNSHFYPLSFMKLIKMSTLLLIFILAGSNSSCQMSCNHILVCSSFLFLTHCNYCCCLSSNRVFLCFPLSFFSFFIELLGFSLSHIF